MPQFVHDGLSFSYKIVGEGYPFFLLHGLGNNNLQTRDMYQPIEGIMCVLPDQRGHGESEADEDMSIDTLADDVIRLADHLGIDRFAIGGISMGAAVSVATCLKYPDRVTGMLLIRNAWCDRTMPQMYVDLFSALADALKENDRDVLLKSPAYETVLKQDSETAVSMFSFFEDQISLKYPDKFASIPGQHPIRSLEELKKIKIPVIILANRQDEIHSYHYGEILHDAIGGSEFHEIACKKENKEQYDSDINRYLRVLLAEIER
ncbi:MAG: alpha/beta hydrolase [Erysipelotrichaceae bacterium]|nr:alpha/beta hydrolase [Erysipelotrichaceae bacterium]